MNVYPKFIIEDGAIILGRVTYHKNLVVNKDLVRGGGIYNIDFENNTIMFSGESHDFGPARLEDIKQAVNKGKVFFGYFSEDDLSKKYKCSYINQTGEITNLN